MFWGPEDHIQSLERIWVDRIIHASAWSELTQRVTAEWQQFILAVLYLHAFFLDIRLTRSGN